MLWDEPALFVIGLSAVMAVGCLLPIQIDDREDHIVLTIAAAVAGGILGIRALVLVWSGVAFAVPVLLAWSFLPGNRDRLGLRGWIRKVGFVALTAFAVTVGFFLANFVYVGIFSRDYPCLLYTSPSPRDS